MQWFTRIGRFNQKAILARERHVSATTNERGYLTAHGGSARMRRSKAASASLHGYHTVKTPVASFVIVIVIKMLIHISIKPSAE